LPALKMMSSVTALEDQFFLVTLGFSDIILKGLNYFILWFHICVEHILKTAMVTTACHLHPYYSLNSVCLLSTTLFYNRKKEMLT